MFTFIRRFFRTRNNAASEKVVSLEESIKNINAKIKIETKERNNKKEKEDLKFPYHTSWYGDLDNK